MATVTCRRKLAATAGKRHERHEAYMYLYKEHYTIYITPVLGDKLAFLKSYLRGKK